MARRTKRIDHDNHDRWLISYADFITLLFAFFVVMYAISSVNEGKYRVFSNSLNNAFSRQPGNVSPTATPSQEELLLKALVDKRTARLGEQQSEIQKRMKNIADGLSQTMSSLIEQNQVLIEQTRRGVVIDVSASLLFGTGEAILQPGAQDVLRQVSAVLGKEDFQIEVEGHTDDVPISTAQFPSNWELSSARASSVVRKLVENGVPPGRMVAVGLASNQPLVPNDSAENRARNRRVTITIVSPNAERDQVGE